MAEYDEIFYERRYMRLREVFDSLVETILGQGYYNMGMDVCGCDECSGEDIANKLGNKTRENYIKILRAKANTNEMQLKIKTLQIENDKLKNINLSN